MVTIMPFEIISRKEKSLLISYLSSVDLSHEGMIKALEVLKQSIGEYGENELNTLLENNDIPIKSGKDFLISNGIITPSISTQKNIWETVAFFTDIEDDFNEAKLEWKMDGIEIFNVYNINDLPSFLPENTLIWVHLETYLPRIIKKIYDEFDSINNVAFVQSYYQKELLRIDGVYSPKLGTPCHFCHMERWLKREEKSFGKNDTSWANLLLLLQEHDIGLPAICLGTSDKGFSRHVIRRRLQELIGNPLVKLHVDTFMTSVSMDLLTCEMSREPVIHWHACDCVEK